MILVPALISCCCQALISRPVRPWSPALSPFCQLVYLIEGCFDLLRLKSSQNIASWNHCRAHHSIELPTSYNYITLSCMNIHERCTCRTRCPCWFPPSPPSRYWLGPNEEATNLYKFSGGVVGSGLGMFNFLVIHVHKCIYTCIYIHNIYIYNIYIYT